VRAALLAAFVLLAPRASLACAVCMSGREEASQWAFIGTTIALSLLPLSLVGGMVWWIRRRLRQLEAEEAEQRIAALRPAPIAPRVSSGAATTR
jgi:hypothetical protein